MRANFSSVDMILFALYFQLQFCIFPMEGKKKVQERRQNRKDTKKILSFFNSVTERYYNNKEPVPLNDRLPNMRA